jgi:hypothetical protein
MNLRTMLSALGLLTAINGTAGCYVEWGRDGDRRTVPPTPSPITPGDLDPPTFTFTQSQGCTDAANASACGFDRPMMVGVREVIRFSIPNNAFSPAPEVTASDPEVLAITSVERSSELGEGFQGTLAVRALRVGAAELRVRDANGTTWGYPIRVDEPAGMTLQGRAGDPRFDGVEGRLRLRVGERVSLSGHPVNLNVERLYAHEGVTWTAPDTDTVSLSWQATTGARVLSDQVSLQGRAPGAVTLQVRAGVVERTVVVEVSN